MTPDAIADLDSCGDTELPRRMLKMAVQQGRSERRGESYSAPYVEPLSDARTMLADFVNSLQVEFSMSWAGKDLFGISCEKFGSAKLES